MGKRSVSKKKKEKLVWVRDAETGEKLLVDSRTGEKIGKWTKNSLCDKCSKEN